MRLEAEDPLAGEVHNLETPLHRPDTVYWRLVKRTATSAQPTGVLRSIVDGWFYALEEEVLAGGTVTEGDDDALLAATTKVMDARLLSVSRTAPALAAALRGYRRAVADGDAEAAEGLLAWLGGQPNVAAGINRQAVRRGGWSRLWHGRTGDTSWPSSCSAWSCRRAGWAVTPGRSGCRPSRRPPPDSPAAPQATRRSVWLLLSCSPSTFRPGSGSRRPRPG